MNRRDGAQPPSAVILAAAAGAALCLHGGCVQPVARAGRDADASIAAVRTEIRDVRAALVEMRTDFSAGRDVNQNDKWTLRLLGLGVLTLGLSYPVGKVVWLAMAFCARRASAKLPPSTPGMEWSIFREPRTGISPDRIIRV